jgi:hypothetical protein
VAEPIFETFANKMTETLEAWIAGKPIPLPFVSK